MDDMASHEIKIYKINLTGIKLYYGKGIQGLYLKEVVYKSTLV